MSNDKALVVRDDIPLSELGRVLSESKYFQDATQAQQCIVKVLAGRELGFGPIASMTGVYIIKGRPAFSANLMAAAVKRSAKYDYRVREQTAEKCVVEFFERVNGGLESIGKSEFSIADARKAGTQNLEKFPRNMLFSRAMSNGVRWYCPDVLSGTVYTPEELGANVNEEGEVIAGEFSVVSDEQAQEPPAWVEQARQLKADGKGLAQIVAALKAAGFDDATPGTVNKWLK